MIERLTGEPLGWALAQRIFEPLQLRNTTFSWHPPGLKHMAHGYALMGSDLPLPNGRPRDVTRAGLHDGWASAAIVSNVDDLADFYSALFGGKLLRRELLNEMQQTVPTDSPGLRAGLGTFRYPVACGYAWGHGGNALGYSDHVLTSKDGLHVVVVAANGWSPEYQRTLEDAAKAAYCMS
jgi:D-alanyl-D-alanine carboxypeptidase